MGGIRQIHRHGRQASSGDPRQIKQENAVQRESAGREQAGVPMVEWGTQVIRTKEVKENLSTVNLVSKRELIKLICASMT